LLWEIPSPSPSPSPRPLILFVFKFTNNWVKRKVVSSIQIQIVGECNESVSPSLRKLKRSKEGNSLPFERKWTQNHIKPNVDTWKIATFGWPYSQIRMD